MDMTANPNLHLEIATVPTYPFVNLPFDVQLFLVDDKSQLKTNFDVEITGCVIYEDSQTPCEKSILAIDSATPIKISRNGMVNVSLRLLDVSMNHDNNKFILKFNGTSPNTVITPVVSTPMLCILHRLVVKEFSSNPLIWYKDEGGRENSIEMSLSLVDHEKQKVLNRRINLKLSLKYDNGQDCPKQEILKATADAKLYIDETTGEATIKFRIEEVSRSHQKQLFKVLIAPDALQYPPATDVSPDLSVPIEVRSKRNKKDKNDFNEPEEPPEKKLRPDISTLNKQVKGEEPRKFSLHQDQMSSTTTTATTTQAATSLLSSERSLDIFSSSSTRARNTESLDNRTHSESPRLTRQIENSTSSTLESNSLHVTGLQSGFINNNTNSKKSDQQYGIQTDQSLPSNSSNLQRQNFSSEPPSLTQRFLTKSLGSQNGNQFTSETTSAVVTPQILNWLSSLASTESALLTTIHWTNMVVNSFPEMQWRCIGYERDSSGQTDLSKPLYSIPNPNELIETMSEEYGRSARNGLEVLYDEIINKKIKSINSDNMEAARDTNPDLSSGRGSSTTVSSSLSQQQEQQLSSNMQSSTDPIFNAMKTTTNSNNIDNNDYNIFQNTNETITTINTNPNVRDDENSNMNSNNGSASMSDQNLSSPGLLLPAVLASSSGIFSISGGQRSRGSSMSSGEPSLIGTESDYGNDDGIFVPRSRTRRSDTGDLFDEFLDTYGPFI